MGDAKNDDLRVGFDSRLRLKFRTPDLAENNLAPMRSRIVA